MKPAAPASRRFHPVACALATVLATASGVMAQPTTKTNAGPVTRPTVLDTPPDYSAYTQSVKVPFTRSTRYENLTSMNVRVSLNDSPPMLFQVDTGSVGILLGASELRGFDPTGTPGNITYTSSGISFDGVYNDVKVTFVDAKGPDGKPVTAYVPVLAATSRRVLPGAVNASTRPAATQPNFNPKPRMMGIGFGRGRESHQERNPFVNLEAMNAGTMRRGYTITRQGYTLGLTKETVGDGYVFQQLAPKTPSTQMAQMRPGLKDWDNAPGWVTVNGVDEPLGWALLDTGLTNMMIGRPDTPQQDIEPGTPITVHLMDGKLQYDFVVGDTTHPTTPRRVTRTNRPTPYVNTGLRALAVFDYLYDADGGYFGLRPTPMPTTKPTTVPAARPATVRATRP
jgi:hypothetical protein